MLSFPCRVRTRRSSAATRSSASSHSTSTNSSAPRRLSGPGPCSSQPRRIAGLVTRASLRMPSKKLASSGDGVGSSGWPSMPTMSLPSTVTRNAPQCDMCGKVRRDLASIATSVRIPGTVLLMKNSPAPVDTVDEDAIASFAENGWLLVSTLDDAGVRDLQRWCDDIAAWPDDGDGWMHHREMTDEGPKLCRSENLIPFHDGLRALLTTGPLVETAGALLGEPALLCKEKINYKLAGG